MNALHFFFRVAELRKNQQEYYKTRSRDILLKCTAMEKELDQEIERAMPYAKKQLKEQNQGGLFESQND